MDIVFGLSADEGAFPPHGGTGAGAVGAPVVGPNGLLGILETALGMGSPPIAKVVRVASFQAVLEGMDGGPRFWSRSLAVDAWATSRTLLNWRDELVDAGWSADRAWAAARLSDLAAAERESSSVGAGLADRIAAMSTKLAATPRLPIRRIRLVDRRALHTAGWRGLLNGLEACGVLIEEIEVKPAAPADTALGRLQRWMIDGGDLGGLPDGTVTVATASSSALAAEVVGQWFERSQRDGALIAQEADTHLLDHGLHAAGQPRAGRSQASAHRGSLQLLLLAFKGSWAPFDAHALMELLVFPTSPIASRAGRRLSAALEQAPGRGGDAWIEAWRLIEERELQEAGEDAKEQGKARSRVDRWRSWAEVAVADPIAGMPLEAALAICDRTVAWAVAHFSRDQDPLYQATATLASDVRAALGALKRQTLPRTLIDRIIDQALDTGHANPGAEAEAAPWRSVSQPGAIWGPASTVVWWNFQSTVEGGGRRPWVQAERDELAAAGCSLDEVSRAGQAASAGWERAVLNAQNHVLFVMGALTSGDDETLHPLAHRLAPALDRLADRKRLEDALSMERLTIAGVDVMRVPVQPVPLPQHRSRWMTPAGYAARLGDVSESATSFENLLACQLMWALKHVARLRPGRIRSIPDANQLLGNLAHALARDVFLPGPPPDPLAAAASTAALLDARIDQLAAPLRHPEMTAELAFACDRLPSAMAQLAAVLVENDLEIEATELQVSGAFENALAVRGAVDLVARDRDGNAVIIDLKWTRNARSRLEELRSGRAVQLSTYGAMVTEGAPYRAGYFLLNQRQFATLTQGGLIGRAVTGDRDFPETWTAIMESWRRLRAAAEEGGLVARGVDGMEEHMPADLPIEREVKCEWCDYATLCRVRGLS